MTTQIILENLNLGNAEKILCIEALKATGNLTDAAKLLGITRHKLKRRMIKHGIEDHKNVKSDQSS